VKGFLIMPLRAIRSLFHGVALFLPLFAAPSGMTMQAQERDVRPPIRHVFILTLENKNYSDTFGPASAAPYLSQTLVKQGALLRQYYGTGHASLDNYVAMISGQPTTPETSADCYIYGDFQQTGTAPDGQAVGRGCVYPDSVKTLVDQLNAAGLTWKGYMGDMGNDPARESGTCGHPVLNTPDLTEKAEGVSARVPQGDMYVTRHDPFAYFHSVIDSPLCQKNVVNLNRLPEDLKFIATTANFNFITPNLCDDGHDAPCVDGRPGGLFSINAFLQKWVPLILASPAYKKDGLLFINFDEGSSGAIERNQDGIAVTFYGATCCNQQPGPNIGPYPKIETHGTGEKKRTVRTISFGGERTGAVLLSPYIQPGTISDVPYNHYSLLKSVEDIFGLNEHLGYAGQPGLVGFGSDVFTGAFTGY
jgi:phosphatidylinositol-3-phosphatase